MVQKIIPLKKVFYVSFITKYVLHHFWLGVIMIVEALLLLSKSKYTWGGIYLGFGIFFFIDDLLAETKDISVMKRLPEPVQEGLRLKILGAIVFIVQLLWFLYLYLNT